MSKLIQSQIHSKRENLERKFEHNLENRQNLKRVKKEKIQKIDERLKTHEHQSIEHQVGLLIGQTSLVVPIKFRTEIFAFEIFFRNLRKIV